MAFKIEFPYEIPQLVDLLREVVLTNSILHGFLYLPEFRDIGNGAEVLLPAMLIDDFAIDCCRESSRVLIVYPEWLRSKVSEWLPRGEDLLDSESSVCGYPSRDGAVLAIMHLRFSFVVRKGGRVVIATACCNDDSSNECYNVAEIDASTGEVRRVSRIDALYLSNDLKIAAYIGNPSSGMYRVLNRYHHFKRALVVRLPYNYSDRDTVHVVAYNDSTLVTERIQVEEEEEDQDQDQV